MEQKKRRGRPAGAKNKIEKSKGVRLSAWLPSECAARFESLRGSRTAASVVCAALSLAARYPEEFAAFLEDETRKPLSKRGGEKAQEEVSS